MAPPSPSRLTLLTASVLAVAFGVIFVWLRHSAFRPSPPPTEVLPNVKVPARPPAPPPVVLHELAAEYSQLISNPDQTSESRINNLISLLELYRRACGGTPCGHNELIVSSILGSNEKNVQLLPSDSPAIQRGELVDEWGTPYWFHTLTDRYIEVRSAGPDRELFTSDDITTHPGTGS
ncbi:hypothetical protein [Verrucomicrobium spinosum]|uniref:hypothetical protein n=1 Tax=Verrucomicrobium spinosum TaxID=2736 RepID=UPI0012F6488B|nr:hypothetical protein [Verrucomicrobium spinosum]